MSNDFELLARRCSKGDADAMLQMSLNFRKRTTELIDYAKVADMWVIRAMLYGNKEANTWVEGNPCCKSNSLFPYDNFIPGKRSTWYVGDYSGVFLNEIGLFYFDPEGIYELPGIDNNRVILAKKYVGYDPPDGDGFGAEYYYDWFYMDEFFNIIEGIPVLKYMSSQDRRGCCKNNFEEMQNKLAEVLNRRRK